MNENVVIIGASGHGKVICDILRAQGDNVLGFLDDMAQGTCCDLPILGKVQDADKFSDAKFIIAIGANGTRKRIGEELKVSWHTAIHPSAVISPSAVIGEGTVIMPLAVVQAEAVVGAHCIVNTAAVVEHENRLADYVHLSPNAALGGNVWIGEGSHVGIGVCVRNNIRICSGCTIGAGAAVVSDLEAPGTYVGIPARRLK